MKDLYGFGGFIRIVSELAHDRRIATQHQEFFVVNNKKDRGTVAVRLLGRQLGDNPPDPLNPPNPF